MVKSVALAAAGGPAVVGATAFGVVVGAAAFCGCCAAAVIWSRKNFVKSTGASALGAAAAAAFCAAPTLGVVGAAAAL